MKQLQQQIPRKRQNLTCQRLLVGRKKIFILNLQKKIIKKITETLSIAT